eukprot:TRINITY_DN6243_c0_g1_i1.p1 TRINITY_DN6243_c0_g1~~TRINITY_DN6243_c0_g1_i1.p1  ORF type:complete len:175 (+),score=24.96 TRINITY_DN6243_c0_g1_i1:83-607(+)
MSCSGKTVGILVAGNVEDLELHYPRLRFKEEDAKVLLIGPTADYVGKGKHGLIAKADSSIDSVTAVDIDCLIVPGGWAPDFWRRDERFKSLVRDIAKDESKVLATICHGPWLLCSARVLQGKRLTCFHAIRDDVENAGGEFVDEEVVVDGNLITSRVPDDLPAFCKAIIAAMRK